MAKIGEQQKDICPQCEAQLELGEGVVEGDTFSRDVRCSHCDFEGEQIYHLVFSELIEK